MHPNLRSLALMVAAAALAAGCATAKPPSSPSATDQGTSPPPAAVAGQQGSSDQADAVVLDYLKRGAPSPDGTRVAAIVPGAGNTASLWLARNEGQGPREPKRVATDVSMLYGPPRWTPPGTLLFASDRDEVTWLEYDPATGSTREYLPLLLKGRRAVVGANAFSPDGRQFYFTVNTGQEVEVWVAATDGSDARKVGVNVRARWVDGQLETAPIGK